LWKVSGSWEFAVYGGLVPYVNPMNNLFEAYQIELDELDMWIPSLNMNSEFSVYLTVALRPGCDL
jgi:hypothetical protein